jgi:NADPH-dependent 2,4-dienoyl-CoA reductase/sulfur reductase-like enzyme
MTGSAAVQGIRQVDPEGSVGLIGAETVPPYDRPPLTKGLWKGKPVEKIWRKTAEPGVETRLGSRIVSLDPQEQLAEGDQGEVYSYEKLLLATGGVPFSFLWG